MSEALGLKDGIDGNGILELEGTLDAQKLMIDSTEYTVGTVELHGSIVLKLVKTGRYKVRFSQFTPCGNPMTSGSAFTIAKSGAIMQKIQPPRDDWYDFEGYYDANDTQYYDVDGNCIHFWDKDAPETLSAKWTEKDDPIDPGETIPEEVVPEGTPIATGINNFNYGNSLWW